MNFRSILISVLALCVFESALGAVEKPMNIETLRTQMKAALDHRCLVVTGTVISKVDGKPLSTTSFTGRFKRPSQWLITWQDTGLDTFKLWGEVWGDGITSHLRFAGKKDVQTSTNTQMTIATATGISQGIAPWLHALFHGQLQALIPDDGNVSTEGEKTIVTAQPRAGNSQKIITSHGLLTGAGTVMDTSKSTRDEEFVPDDATLITVIEGQGGIATPEKLAEVRVMLAEANAVMKTSTPVFSSTYEFTWQVDRELTAEELLPDASHSPPE